MKLGFNLLLWTPHVTAQHEGILRDLKKTGYDDEQADVIADHVMDAALCGYEYSGLPKLLNVFEHSNLRQPRRRLKAVHETPISAMIDGGNNCGMYTLMRAAEMAIARACRRATGSRRFAGSRRRRAATARGRRDARRAARSPRGRAATTGSANGSRAASRSAVRRATA